MEERSTGMSWIAVLFVIIVVVAINGACSKINTQTRQFYAVRFL